ncbi:restriction endonuclease subunit S [Mesorhizobium sp. CA10]|uniref:restriction endonuclease subunit S n=1 Tax=Mesorhizobium sp. CA10 TaxID=588495 RepID=UPI001CCBC726|nr:restriction endonuclease subunit S [Mesorhizobium sp. CA10]MBZ9884822.1 restriction endonuclease subunit S [Mesorhizobium sp. CA10]
MGDYFVSRRERGELGLPTLSVTVDRGLVLRESLERRTETTLAPEQHLRVYPGDIPYNMMRMWQGASGLADRDAVVSPAYVVLTPGKNVDPRFAAYLFKLPEMIHRFWAYSYGLTEDRLRLYFNDFKRIPRALPPLPEQKKIAEILSTWDAAIATAEKLATNAKAQKRALMQQLLTGKRRLTGFEGQKWAPARLGDALDIAYGKSPNGIISENGSYPIVGTGGVTGRTNERITKNPVIVVGRKGTIDKPFMVETPCWPIDTTFYCQAKKGSVLRWAYYMLQTIGLRKYNEASGVPSLSRDTLRAIHVWCPSEQEQLAIADVLLVAEDAVGRLEAKVALLKSEKLGLMQQLLTGRRRVMV